MKRNITYVDSVMPVPNKEIKGECPKCGKPYTHGKFCTKCGTSLIERMPIVPPVTPINRTPRNTSVRTYGRIRVGRNLVVSDYISGRYYAL